MSGTAKPAGSKTIGRKKDGSLFIRDASGSSGTVWRKTVRQAAVAAMANRDMLVGPLVLVAVFTVARPKDHWVKSGLSAEGRRNPHPIFKPDLTKLVRAIEDACTGVIWNDDAQIVEQICYKEYCTEVGQLPTVLVMVGKHKEEEVVRDETEEAAGRVGNGAVVRGAEEDHPTLFPSDE